MLSVYFFDQDNTIVGEIHLEDGEFTLVPEDSERLKHIIADPVIVGYDSVFAKDDPERFMVNLYKHYKSIALRATEAYEDDED